MRRLWPRTCGDAGAMTLWLLGLSLVLLAVGGISIDLWRVTTQRRVLAAAVDAAAAAGAGVLDLAHLRATGELQLEPDGAEAVAGATMAELAPAAMSAHAATATPTSVQVVAEGEVAISLLRLILPDAPPVIVRVEAVAVPRATP